MIKYIKELKSRFVWNTKEKEIIDFIKKNDFKTRVSNAEIAVVISPWFRTYIPWFSIVLGLLIKKKYKKNILFIIDDLPFSNEKYNPKFQIKSIKKAATFLLKHSDVIFLSQQHSSITDMALIEKYAYFNTVHDLKTENFGENNQYFKLLKKQLTKSSAKIDSIFENQILKYIIVPGGLCATSGFFTEAAKQKNIRIVSYDSGVNGELILSTNGVAAHLSDIPNAVNIMLSSESFDFESIHQNVVSLIKDRMEGKDIFKSQIGNSVEANFSNSILLPLNVNWDTSALNMHKFFKDSIEWIIETTQWILDNSDKQIIIRQHPVERFEYGKSYDDYKHLLLESFGNNARIIFISANDPINTYDILAQTDIVITHTSTVATEAAILGKKVITVSNAYYANIGYVYAPDNKEDYFKSLKNILDNKLEVNEEKYKKAILTYFVSQRLNWFFPEFLPSLNIEKWINSSCDNILEMNGSTEMLESIETDIPLSIIVWRKTL